MYGLDAVHFGIGATPYSSVGVLFLDLADDPGLAEQHRGRAGSKGSRVVLHLGIVDLVLLHGVDHELQRGSARIIVEVVVVFPARGLHDHGGAGALEQIAELLGDAAALAREA